MNFARDKFAIHFTFLACAGASIDAGVFSLMSQLDVIEAIQKENKVQPKLLMLSGGGNDVGFSTIISQLLQKRSLSPKFFNVRLFYVQYQLEKLAERFQSINPGQVIIPTYFQFANNDQGELDTKCDDLIKVIKLEIF